MILNYQLENENKYMHLCGANDCNLIMVVWDLFFFQSRLSAALINPMFNKHLSHSLAIKHLNVCNNYIYILHNKYMHLILLCKYNNYISYSFISLF